MTPIRRFLVILVGNGVLIGLAFVLAANAPKGPSASASPYFAWFGLLAVALLWMMSTLFIGEWNPFALVMGFDNRLSTSKMQALLWTGCVGFVYSMVYADRFLTHGIVASIANVPQNVLLVLGMSATTLVAAKAITTSQVAADPDAKTSKPAPSYDPAELVRDDGAQTTSLIKVQILFWSGIAIFAYIITSFHNLGALAGCVGPDCSFPDIDRTLMLFMGFGHATYLGGKIAGGSADAEAAAQTKNVKPDPPGATTDPAPQTAPTTSAPTTAGAAASHALLHGYDVSFAQGLEVDWDAVKQRNLARFVYARATYATYPIDNDPNFIRNHNECKRLGIPFGAYHFYVAREDGAAQAAHFLSVTDGYTGDLCPMVDVEEQSGRGADMIGNLSAFVTAVEKALNTRVIIYTNQDTWDNAFGGTDAFSGHLLWVSNFTNDQNAPPAMPRGFKDWTLYQYSSSGALPRIGGAATAVDLDVLKGDISQIRLGAGRPTPPGTPQPPTVPPQQPTPFGGDFTLAELTKTDQPFDNTPNAAEIGRLELLAAFMEKVRAILGNNPITINSAFRSEEVNKAVGGVPNSAHRLGYGCDFTCPGFGNSYEVCVALARATRDGRLAFDQLIQEGTWTHISRDPRLRSQLLTKTSGGGYISGIYQSA